MSCFVSLNTYGIYSIYKCMVRTQSVACAKVLFQCANARICWITHEAFDVAVGTRRIWMWILVAESHTVSVLVTLGHAFLKTVFLKSELGDIAMATISLQGLISES